MRTLKILFEFTLQIIYLGQDRQVRQGRQNYFFFCWKMTTLRIFYFHLSLSNAQWVKNLLSFFHLMAQNLKLTRNRGVRVGKTFIYLEETVFWIRKDSMWRSELKLKNFTCFKKWETISLSITRKQCCFWFIKGS